MIDKRIKNSIDPYLILKLETFNTKEEVDYIKEHIENYLTDDELFQLNEFIAAEISNQLDYVIINRSYLPKLKHLIEKCEIKMKITDLLPEIWELADIETFVSNFDEWDKSKIKDILKAVVESKYDVNDVLDKVSDFGVGSLNELNLYILNS